MSEAAPTLEAQVEALIVTDLSPYALSNAMTALMGRTVRPQVLYSYVRQGYIKASKNTLGKWVIGRDTARAWAIKYYRNNKK